MAIPICMAVPNTLLAAASQVVTSISGLLRSTISCGNVGRQKIGECVHNLAAIGFLHQHKSHVQTPLKFVTTIHTNMRRKFTITSGPTGCTVHDPY